MSTFGSFGRWPDDGFGAPFGGGAAPFDPASLLPYAWWRSDNVDTATNFDWLDKSGNGRVQRQSTAGLKPAVTAAVVDGKPALRFDGVDDFLLSTAPATDWTYLHDGTGCETWSFVVPRALTASSLLWATYSSGANPGAWLQWPVDVVRMLGFTDIGGFSFDLLSPATLVVGTPVLIRASYLEGAATECQLFINNTLAASGASLLAPGSGPPPVTLNQGRRPIGANYAQVDYVEEFRFNRVLTALQRSNLYTRYFRSRYPTSVP